MSNPDNYYDPPDEEEVESCEFCGSDLELCTDFGGEKYTKCHNQFCPDKFENYEGGNISVVLEMVNHLAEVEQELADTKLKLRSTQNTLGYVRSKLSLTEEKVVEREGMVEDLENKLTQSQPVQANAVRDTHYQIRRMEDCFVNWGIEMSADAYKGLHDEWMEVKKILETYG